MVAAMYWAVTLLPTAAGAEMVITSAVSRVPSMIWKLGDTYGSGGGGTTKLVFPDGGSLAGPTRATRSASSMWMDNFGVSCSR